MIRRPPRSTLSPTRRSPDLHNVVALARQAEQAIKAGDTSQIDRAAVKTDMSALDRKSTRLNSSHLVISYAVFCLKKKKRLPQTPHAVPQPDASPGTSTTAID